MKGVLEQSQIDLLLQNIAENKTEKKSVSEQKNIKLYDFRIPKKFNKEQLRTISRIHETYARLLSSYLTGTLRTFCRVEVVSIEETRYYEYSNTTSDTNLLGIIEMVPYPGNTVLSLSKELAYTVLDKLMGGSGDCGISEDEYTDIEVSVLERFYKNIVTFLEDAWSNIVSVKPVFKKFETDNSTNIMHLDEIVVIVVMNVTIKEKTGKLSICMPYMWLESISAQLSTKRMFSERTVDESESESSKQAVLSQLYKTPIELSVVLGESRVYISDITNIEVGDILKLNQKIGDNVKVNLGGKTWFYGQLGIKNKNKAVKIINSAV